MREIRSLTWRQFESFNAPSLVKGRWRCGGDDGALFHSIFKDCPRCMPLTAASSPTHLAVDKLCPLLTGGRRGADRDVALGGRTHQVF